MLDSTPLRQFRGNIMIEGSPVLPNGGKMVFRHGPNPIKNTYTFQGEALRSILARALHSPNDCDFDKRAA